MTLDATRTATRRSRRTLDACASLASAIHQPRWIRYCFECRGIFSNICNCLKEEGFPKVCRDGGLCSIAVHRCHYEARSTNPRLAANLFRIQSNIGNDILVTVEDLHPTSIENSGCVIRSCPSGVVSGIER